MHINYRTLFYFCIFDCKLKNIATTYIERTKKYRFNNQPFKDDCNSQNEVAITIKIKVD